MPDNIKRRISTILKTQNIRITWMIADILCFLLWHSESLKWNKTPKTCNPLSPFFLHSFDVDIALSAQEGILQNFNNTEHDVDGKRSQRCPEPGLEVFCYSKETNDTFTWKSNKNIICPGLFFGLVFF